MDDPLDAVAVHGAGGIIGLLAVPWFMYTGFAVMYFHQLQFLVV